MPKKQAFLWPIVGLILAGTLSAFPLWLESPDRLNPNDPKSRFYTPFVPTQVPQPTATASPSLSPTPSPTISPTFTTTPTASPSPTPQGISVRLKDIFGVPVAGAKVMLNANAAGAQTSNAMGEVFFSGAVPPADIHAFSPDDGGGNPTHSPTLFSYFNCGVDSVDFGFYNPLSVSTVTLSWNVSASAGGTRSETYLVENNMGASASLAPCASSCFPSIGSQPVFGGERWAVTLLELNAPSNILAAHFRPPTLVPPAGDSFSGPTSSSGYAVTSASFSFDSYAGSDAAQYSAMSGASGSRYFLRQKLVFPPAPSSFQVAVPTGSTPVILRGDTIRQPFPYTDFYLASHTYSSAGMPSTPAFTHPGEIWWTDTADSVSPSFTVAVNSGGTADAWFFLIGDYAGISWWGMELCAGCSTVTRSIPTAFPAGVPANYAFSPGNPTDHYINGMTGGFNPAAPMNYNLDDATQRGHYSSGLTW